MENGSLVTYLQKNPNADRPKFIREAAEGLNYLHENHIAHGSVKAANILVSNTGQALLCDYQLAVLIPVAGSVGLKGGESLRRDSPELWEGAPRSEKSDVYAFGMTIYEILSGNVPFHQSKSVPVLIRTVINKGELPPLEPAHSTSGISYEPMWTVAQRCWTKLPDERPTMAEVVEMLDTPTVPISDVRSLNDEPESTEVPSETSNPTPPTVAPPLTVSRRSRSVQSDQLTASMRPTTPAGRIQFDAEPLDYTAQIKQYTLLPKHRTRFTEMYRGDVSGNKVVLISAIRSHRFKIGEGSPKRDVDRGVKRQIRLWKDQLSHPAIIQYLGHAIVDGLPCAISEWHQNRNVIAYLEMNPSADRYALIRQIVGGLRYLHSQKPAPIVHGDLICRNVVINDKGDAVLRNFGLWSLHEDHAPRRRRSFIGGFIADLFDPRLPSTDADVYFFGRLSLEILTRKNKACSGVKHKKLIRRGIYKGHYKAEDYFPQLWMPFIDVLETCWSRHSKPRPTMEEVYQALNQLDDGPDFTRTIFSDVPEIEYSDNATDDSGSDWVDDDEPGEGSTPPSFP
ncbi:hypothetical protein FRB99_000290 [Tulasnella sp. 403]|nr:hypothetical protein FRB99_000290 [Tulasnella sp. 403]